MHKMIIACFHALDNDLQTDHCTSQPHTSYGTYFRVFHHHRQLFCQQENSTDIKMFHNRAKAPLDSLGSRHTGRAEPTNMQLNLDNSSPQ